MSTQTAHPHLVCHGDDLVKWYLIGHEYDSEVKGYVGVLVCD